MIPSGDGVVVKFANWMDGRGVLRKVAGEKHLAAG